jgi:hypothetical protein
LSFLYEDEITYPAGGSNTTVNIKKEPVEIRYRSWTLREMYNKYKDRYPGSKISFSSFYKNVPKNIQLPKKKLIIVPIVTMENN